MFYSINSPIPALSGLDLAGNLIKQTAKKLSTDFPSLSTFSTLSPLPSFLSWLALADPDTINIPPSLIERLAMERELWGAKTPGELGLPPPPIVQSKKTLFSWLIAFLKSSSSRLLENLNDENSSSLNDLLKDLLLWLSAEYLINQKQLRGFFVLFQVFILKLFFIRIAKTSVRSGSPISPSQWRVIALNQLESKYFHSRQ
jgi:hypothetical protein